AYNCTDEKAAASIAPTTHDWDTRDPLNPAYNVFEFIGVLRRYSGVYDYLADAGRVLGGHMKKR
ncbi:hypothetical protein Y032_1268g3791, partial [Ancylostoma ceylanicum]